MAHDQCRATTGCGEEVMVMAESVQVVPDNVRRRPRGGLGWRSRVWADRLALGMGCRVVASIVDRIVARYARRSSPAGP